MGSERAYREPAEASEIAAMQRLLSEALDAGALGFSTSRSRLDRDFEGRSTPSCFAEDREIESLGRVLTDRGRGIIELAFRGSAGDEPEQFENELEWMCDLAAATRRPVTFGLAQLDAIPDRWSRAHEIAGAARASGVELRPQTLGRMQSVLVGLEVVHPFANRPTYRALAALPLPDRIQKLREPDTRARILAEPSGPPSEDDPFSGLFTYDPNRIFTLEAVPDYEPGPEKSLAALARRQGLDPIALLYDLILEDEGRRLLLYAVANYHGGDHSVAHAMLSHPSSLLGLGDGGAHSGLICDTGLPTFMLTHWARDRSRGPRFPIERIVHRLTGEPAQLFGLGDRGLLRPGLRADVNVLDFEALALEPPRVAHDLPAGARRLIQGARGYRATFVAGVETRADGIDTGARPGRLARRVDG
jgi:N-acyl-D-aspartate/D-glutamate deacylase